MADNNLFKEKLKLLNEIKRIQDELGKEESRSDSRYKRILDKIVTINQKLSDINKTQKDNVDNAISLERKSKSLNGVYSNQSVQLKIQSEQLYSISESMKFQLAKKSESLSVVKKQIGNQSQLSAIEQQKLDKKINSVSIDKAQLDIVNDILENYKKKSDIASELSQLSSDDILAQQQLNAQYGLISEQITAQKHLLDKRTNIAKEFLSINSDIESSLESQYADSIKIASLNEEQRKILEEQASAFQSIKDKISALGSTITTYLNRPQAAIGALIIGSGFVVDKFGELNKEFGQTFLQGLNKATLSAGALGLIFEDTAGTVNEISSQFGDISAATFGTQLNVGLIASNMGISNKEAVGLLASFARLNDGSTDIAADMIKTSQEFARQNGIIPARLMQDIADSAEEFALFGKDGGKNILEAAGYAQKLGVNMKTISGIADTLLDFESSISKELELGAMLGKNINLNKARQLAFENDLEGATKATLEALGGVNEFEKMNYFERKATAELIGVSVADLQKMVHNEEKAAEMGGVMQQKFSAVSESINLGLNKYLGTGLKGLGGAVTMVGELNLGFSALGMPIQDVVKGTGRILGNLMKMIAAPVLKGLKGVGTALSQTSIGKSTGKFKDKLLDGVKSPKSTESISEKINKQTGGKSGFNVTNMLKGAAAILILSAALFVAAKAFQEFATVTWESVAMGIVSLTGLALVAKLLGKAMPEIIQGSIAIGILGVALIPLAYALRLISPLVEAFGTVITSVFNGLSVLVEAVANSFVKLMNSISLESAAAVFALGPAFASAAIGIGVFSMALAGLGMGSLFGGNMFKSILKLGEYSDKFSVTATSLESIATAINNISNSLKSIDTSKLNEIKDFSLSTAVGSGILKISESVGGFIDTIGDLVVNNESSDTENTDKLLLQEIIGLRNDLTNGKVAVYMDGEKVTAGVSKVVDRIGSNSYALK